MCNDNCTVNLEKCLLSSHARYLDESARSMMYLLNSNEKPTQKAPVKESDAVVIQAGGDLSEHLPDIAETTEPPKDPDKPDKPDTPVIPDNPDNPDQPHDPDNPDNPDNGDKQDNKSSCSSSPMQGTEFPAGGIALLGLMMSAVLIRRRRNHL